MANPVNAELVGITWLRSLPEVAAQVATTVPERGPEFLANGFLQVLSVGGAPHLYTGLQESMLSLSAFAYRDGSRAVPWGKAASILGQVKRAVDGLTVHADLETPAGFDRARIIGASVNRDPLRVPDEGGMARYELLLSVRWVSLP